MSLGEDLLNKVKIQTKIKIEEIKLNVKRTIFVISIWTLGVITGVTFYYATGALKSLLEPRVIIISNAQASQTQEIEPQQVIKEKDLSDYIWFKESTRGQHNYSKCEAQGKYNTIGFGIPGNGTFQCFNSHAEEMDALKKWIAQHQEEGLSSKQLLCHYNTGKIIEDCAYVSQF